MAKNFIQPGVTISVIAAAAIASGAGVQVGNLFGVAAYDAALGEEVEITTQGVFSINKNTSEAASVGDALYWDDTAKEITTTVGSNKLVGSCVKDALAADTTVEIRLFV